MRNLQVVIGANFGDEGKGLMTDYFCSQMKTRGIVVRFNGGAQAGHTVQTPDKRHVFGHLGSGTFLNIPTYLGKHFTCNPILLLKELDKLKLGSLPEIYAHPDCFVTTPYDMLINQLAEKARGDAKHGSCGVGCFETVKRNRDHAIAYSTRLRDITNEGYLRQVLDGIREHYVRSRLGELGVLEYYPDSVLDILESSDMYNRFVGDVLCFLHLVKIADTDLLLNYQDIVFEGAQGLMLDQDWGMANGYFPHVTSSNTGLKNVVEIMDELYAEGLDDPLNVTYVTRPYLTRHGAGPMPTELNDKPYSKIQDMTNLPNQFQGALRFGWLDLNTLAERIEYDLEYAKELEEVIPHIAISCMDHINSIPRFIMEEKLVTSPRIVENIVNLTKAHNLYLSTGPQRNNITRSGEWI